MWAFTDSGVHAVKFPEGNLLNMVNRSPYVRYLQYQTGCDTFPPSLICYASPDTPGAALGLMEKWVFHGAKPS